MSTSNRAAVRGLGIIALLVGVVGVLSWKSVGSTQQAPSPEVAAFLNVVDVDGDEVHTPGDRAVMEWWLAHGGNAATVLQNVNTVGEVQSVHAFLNSPAAQLAP